MAIPFKKNSVIKAQTILNSCFEFLWYKQAHMSFFEIFGQVFREILKVWVKSCLTCPHEQSKSDNTISLSKHWSDYACLEKENVKALQKKPVCAGYNYQISPKKS